MDTTEKIIAFCGIVCTDCAAYKATQIGEKSELERVAAQWKEDYHLERVTLQDVTCDGCLGEAGRKGAHCFECDIRACGLLKNVDNCAYCADYTCDKLESFFGFVPDARVLLDNIRASI